jgi:pimeloyl-ACP methyl ester carboxylesterase
MFTQTQLDPQFMKYYADVPREDLEPFLAFRAEHPFKSTLVHDIQWEYLDAGQGSVVLLILPGALGDPIMDWRHISYFSHQHRVIAPNYAPLPSMETLVDGIAGILDAEGINSVHAWGGSYGGMVAQIFVRRHPSMTKKLIISHSLPPNPQSGAQLRSWSRWFTCLPGGVLRWVMNRSLRRLLPENGEGFALPIAIYNELMRTRMTKKYIISIINRTIQYSEMAFHPDDLASWSGSVLLMMSEDDPSTPEETRNNLQALYPGAQMHLFQGSGHATSLLQENAYRAVIEAFMKA